MTHHYNKPHQQLLKFVRTVLTLENDVCKQCPINNLPVFTNGMSALVCRTEKNKHSNNHVVELSLYGKSVPSEIILTEQTGSATTIIYFFYPFVVAPLFNLATSQLQEAPVDIHNWNAHITTALKTQLVYAGTTHKLISILDNLLVQQLHENNRQVENIRYATDKIMCNKNMHVLSALQSELKLTERTFQRLFKKFVGITPNQYRRICQFQDAFTQVKAANFEKLTDVAYDNDFADQSHFIRTFKEFSQMTPNTYLKAGLHGRK